jgi:hypothetical protein
MVPSACSPGAHSQCRKLKCIHLRATTLGYKERALRQQTHLHHKNTYLGAKQARLVDGKRRGGRGKGRLRHVLLRRGDLLAAKSDKGQHKLLWNGKVFSLSRYLMRKEAPAKSAVVVGRS